MMFIPMTSELLSNSPKLVVIGNGLNYGVS